MRYDYGTKDHTVQDAITASFAKNKPGSYLETEKQSTSVLHEHHIDTE